MRRCRWWVLTPHYGRRVTEHVPGPTEWGETPGVGPWKGALPDDPRYDLTLLLDSRVAANIDLKQVRVGADAVVGTIDQGADILDPVLAEAAVALSADMLGGVQQTFDITLEYLKVREQFGAKIGSFQGLKHRAARWFCEKELSKSIVLQSLRALDDKADNVLELINHCVEDGHGRWQGRLEGI